MLTDLEFAYLALDDLKPDPRNPRTHSKKQIQQIADSMTELGFASAILITLIAQSLPAMPGAERPSCWV